MAPCRICRFRVGACLFLIGLWSSCGDEAAKPKSPALEWLFGSAGYARFRLNKESSWIHVARDHKEYFEQTAPYALGPRLAYRIQDHYRDTGMLHDRQLTLMHHYGQRVGDMDAKHYGATVETMSKLFRDANFYYSGSHELVELEKDFDQEVRQFTAKMIGIRTQVYVSAPKDRVAEPHIDDEPIFVLQLSGSKTWRVCHKPMERGAYRDLTWQLKHFAETDKAWKQIAEEYHCDEFSMNPGDFLYIPAGFPHVAKTGNKWATHITFMPHILQPCHSGGWGYYSSVSISCDDYCKKFINGTRCMSTCDSGELLFSHRCDCNVHAPKPENCKEPWGSKVCFCSDPELDAEEAAEL